MTGLTTSQDDTAPKRIELRKHKGICLTTSQDDTAPKLAPSGAAVRTV